MSVATTREGVTARACAKRPDLRGAVEDLSAQLYRVSETQRNCLDNLLGPAPHAADDADDVSENNLQALLTRAHALACRVGSQASEISEKIGGSDEVRETP